MSRIQKTYQYKIYRSGVYLGLLPNVKSDFQITQNINNGSVELQIEVGANVDTADQSNEAILDELGNPITNEVDENLLIERQPDIIGSSNELSLIREFNNVLVYEFSDYYPNGRLCFTGYMESWEAEFGGDDTVTIICRSDGDDVDNYISSIVTYTSEISQAVYDNDNGINNKTGDYIGQTFTPGSNITVTRIRVVAKCTTDATLQLRLSAGTPKIPDYSTVNQVATASVTGGAGYQNMDFTFVTPVTLSSGVQYNFVIIKTAGDNTQQVYHKVTNTNPYAGGSEYLYDSDFGYFIYDETSGFDMVFTIYSSPDRVTAAFSSLDPATMVTQAFDEYIARGGLVSYSGANIDLAGYTTSYTFRMATLLEVIKKCLELAPANYYWYIDPATLQFYFKETSTTADHTFIKGRHIEKLKLTSTGEDIKNAVYFSGGDTGAGSNLLTSYSNTDSLTEIGRQKLERLSDNRVTVSTTADIISESFLDEFADNVYKTPLTILDEAYNTASISVGDTVGFAGFGNFIDSLVVQVASIKYTPDRADLILGKLPFRQTALVEKINRDLALQQTVDNPDSPS